MTTPASSPPGGRKRWVAVLLALFVSPLFSMLYLGRVARGFVYLVVVFGLIAAAAVAAAKGLWPAGVEWTPLIYVLNVVGAIDAYRICAPGALEIPVRWYSRWYGLVGSVLAFFAVTIPIRLLIAEPFEIPSSSMLPTLVPGDQIVVDKHVFGLAHEAPQRGDVVVLRVPGETGTMYVSRVVGMPGDQFAYRGDTVYINGEPVDRSNPREFDLLGTRGVRYEQRLGETSFEVLDQPDVPPRRDFATVVPEGEYLMLGDNRDNARDSRYIGTIPRAMLVGRVVFVWWNTRLPTRAGTSLR